MKRSWSPLLKVLLATLGLVAAAVGGSGLSAQGQKASAPKPSYVTTQYPVKVAFENTGYAVTNDSKGDYTHGVDGVSAYMKVTTQSGAFIDGMFVLEIGTVRNKAVRKLNVNYTGGTLSATTVQVLSYIPVIGVLKTIAGGGGFWTPTATDIGAVFRFRDPLLSVEGSGNYHPANGSDLFLIKRESAIKWTVTTDTDGASYPTILGGDVPGFVGNDFQDVGSTASFESRTSIYGNYTLPFKMTITCLSKCPPAGS